MKDELTAPFLGMTQSDPKSYFKVIYLTGTARFEWSCPSCHLEGALPWQQLGVDQDVCAGSEGSSPGLSLVWWSHGGKT